MGHLGWSVFLILSLVFSFFFRSCPLDSSLVLSTPLPLSLGPFLCLPGRVLPLPALSPQPPCHPGKGRGRAWASCAALAAASHLRSTWKTLFHCSCWSSAHRCHLQRSCMHVFLNWWWVKIYWYLDIFEQNFEIVHIWHFVSGQWE